MFRTLTLTAALLAFAASAQAQDRIAVATVGKSPSLVRSQLYNAAVTVCQSTADALQWSTIDDCTQASYENALDQFRQLPATRLTASPILSTR